MDSVRRAAGTTRVAYLDCPTGIAGDMLLAACIDAGCDLAILTLALEGLKDIKNEWNIVVKSVRKAHRWLQSMSRLKLTNLQPLQRASMHTGTGTPTMRLRTTKPTPSLDKEIQGHTTDDAGRPYADKSCQRHGGRCVSLLGKGRGRVPWRAVEDVHFHEVGAIDSIIDTVGSSSPEPPSVEEVYCSDLPFTGAASTRSTAFCLCQPRPLCVLAASKAVLVPATNLRGELITPTGASLLVGMGAIFSPPPRSCQPRSVLAPAPKTLTTSRTAFLNYWGDASC